jgi:hypothetical protein
MAEKIQWEYRIEVFGSTFRGLKPENVEQYLNDLGLEGWEVVNLHHPTNSSKVWITIKRPLPESTRRRRSQSSDQW